jgi:hypothetical protein
MFWRKAYKRGFSTTFHKKLRTQLHTSDNSDTDEMLHEKSIIAPINNISWYAQFLLILGSESVIFISIQKLGWFYHA